MYLLDKKTNEKYLEYRDYDSFINKSIDKKIKNLSNVIVYTASVSKEDLKKIVPNSFKSVYEDEIFNKYIRGDGNE